MKLNHLFGIVLSCISLVSSAKNVTTVCDTVPVGVLERLTWTVKCSGSEWSVSWNAGRVSVSNDYSDDIVGAMSTITLLDSLENVVARENLPIPGNKDTAIRLMVTPRGMSIVTGGQKTLFRDFILTPPKAGDVLSIEVPSSTRILSHVLNADIATVPAVCSESDCADGDTHCGSWIYVDQITPENNSVINGGHYTLTVVSDPDTVDGYLVLYDGGADIDSSLWTKGAVKARLRPTLFTDHYEAEWFDSKGHPVPDEVRATFHDVNMLTFEFPVLKSVLRFTRDIEQQ